MAERIPSLMRDALTGAPLDLGPNAVIFRVHDLDPRAMPYTIDRREPFHTDGARSYDRAGHPTHSGYAGGFEWSSDFERYIRKALPKSIVEAQRVWREWWTLPVVVERLHVHLGAEKLQAALLYHRDRVDEPVIARRMNHTVWWVRTQQRAAVRLVRSRYLPHGYMREHLASFAASLQAQ